MEVALSVLRILLWALDPEFDEWTGVTPSLNLAEHPPLLTTERNVDLMEPTGNTINLVPERDFLEHITPYTGPLKQFSSPETIALYFTLSGSRNRPNRLYMTFSDMNRRTAFTLYPNEKGLVYYNVELIGDTTTGEMQAELRSEISANERWRNNYNISNLSQYYHSLLHALTPDHVTPPTTERRSMLLQIFNRFRSPWSPQIPTDLPELPITATLPQQTPTAHDRDPPRTAPMPWSWSLVPESGDSNNPSNDTTIPSLDLSPHDNLYVRRGYEHHLKSKLMENWSNWIADGMRVIFTTARNDCQYALANPTSEHAEWELTELDTRLLWEWTKRELNLLDLSIRIEDILRDRMDECIETVVQERQNERLRGWFTSEADIGWRKRLEYERDQAKKRMEEAGNTSADRAGKVERSNGEGGFHDVGRMWQVAEDFIDKKWTGAIEGGGLSWESSVSDLERLRLAEEKQHGGPENPRCTFVKELKPRFAHWDTQREKERHAMENTVKEIRKADFEKLDQAYTYPESSRLATAIHSRFAANLSRFSRKDALFAVNHGSATVYLVNGHDIGHCDLQKSTARSVIGLLDNLVKQIKNEHFLYVGGPYGHKLDVPFVQQNRDRWWEWAEQQTVNSSTFYLSPYGVTNDGVFGVNETRIAHIMIFISTSTRLRLRLLHSREGNADVSICKDEVNLRRMARF